MSDSDTIETIRARLKGNEYFVNPLSDVNVQKDMLFLLDLLQKKDERLTLLEKKSSLLSQQVSELIQELENVKSDFGNNR